MRYTNRSVNVSSGLLPLAPIVHSLGVRAPTAASQGEQVQRQGEARRVFEIITTHTHICLQVRVKVASLFQIVVRDAVSSGRVITQLARRHRTSVRSVFWSPENMR